MSTSSEKLERAKPFFSAAVNVLKSMASTDLQYGSLDTSARNLELAAITSVQGFSGNNLKGNFIMSYDKPSILGVMKRMLMMELEEIDGEVCDAVAEISSMVVTGAKGHLGELADGYSQSPPLLLTASGGTLDSPGEGLSLVVPLTTEDGIIHIAVQFAE